jgi:hypothetical protein
MEDMKYLGIKMVFIFNRFLQNKCYFHCVIQTNYFSVLKMLTWVYTEKLIYLVSGIMTQNHALEYGMKSANVGLMPGKKIFMILKSSHCNKSMRRWHLLDVLHLFLIQRSLWILSI